VNSVVELEKLVERYKEENEMLCRDVAILRRELEDSNEKRSKLILELDHLRKNIIPLVKDFEIEGDS
jgi:predicted RNase H-like nuclease (RuvC/YqgF family)